MKFIFFYSPIYDYYYNHINKNLKGFFDIESIKINDLDNSKGGHTFAGGVSIKIELIIQKIKENLNNTILFTDATIFINSKNVNELADFVNKYTHNDLCFADNNVDDVYNEYNIGIILIKCNEKTLLFFENILSDLIRTKWWDQYLVNCYLNNKNIGLTVEKFDKEKIYCNWNFCDSLRNTYLIYKSFITHTDNIIQNYNKRLDIFKHYGLITDEEYENNYKHE